MVLQAFHSIPSTMTECCLAFLNSRFGGLDTLDMHSFVLTSRLLAELGSLCAVWRQEKTAWRPRGL